MEFSYVGTPIAFSPASALAARYRTVRRFTEELCAPLCIEDYGVQSMPDVSPVKWHLAHVSWFFETFVLAGTPGYEPFHPAFSYLFNSYYNSVGQRHARPERGLLSRPTVKEVYAYRRHVDEAMLALLEKGGMSAEILSVVETGLHHEQQHQELILMDIKHVFSRNPLFPAYLARPSVMAEPAKPLAWLPYPGGISWMGADETGFAFDNERPKHRVFIEPCLLASRLVTNGEYLTFMEDAGYERPEFWLSDGWDFIRRENIRAPLYWHPAGDDGWKVFTLSGLHPLEEAEPVCHVSFYEADAYARWAGARLPAEAEWEAAASSEEIAGNFAENRLFHPSAAAPADREILQLFGDVWEWTSSPYTAYPGYRPAAGSLGEYNGKFMCNQMVLRGGSCATPQSHMRASYRNFFYPHCRWQFAGIRLAQDISE